MSETLLRVALLLQVIISTHGEADPQLNIPAGQINRDLQGRPQVLPNSYTGERSGQHRDRDDLQDGEEGDTKKAGNDFDHSRSERFGPPYDDRDDEEENYPEGRSNDDQRDRQDRPNRVSLGDVKILNSQACEHVGNVILFLCLGIQLC